MELLWYMAILIMMHTCMHNNYCGITSKWVYFCSVVALLHIQNYKITPLDANYQAKVIKNDILILQLQLYRMRLNFRGTKLSRIANLLNMVPVVVVVLVVLVLLVIVYIQMYIIQTQWMPKSIHTVDTFTCSLINRPGLKHRILLYCYDQTIVAYGVKSVYHYYCWAILSTLRLSRQ